MSAAFNEEELIDLLPLYYKRLFPFEPYYRWLTYGNENCKYFQHREFSFTLVDDIYIRFKSFNDKDDFMKELFKDKPIKIDIGAMYSLKPKDSRHSTNFTPLERELVFDIDMTDYDDVRTCCSGADICSKCWRFMIVACKILDTALTEDFGYKHLLWVFSGRRGIHCWVCDEDARGLSTKGRVAVAEYLQLVSGGTFQNKKVNLSGDHIHYSIKRALKIVEQNFKSICLEDQDILGTDKGLTEFLGIITDEGMKKEVNKEMSKYSTSVDRWNAFVSCFQMLQDKGVVKRKQNNLVSEIMLQYTYPRLDINVSKGMTHLLKSPFCVHPKTGKVCVPFNAKKVDKFNPDDVPTVSQLIEEINKFGEKEGSESNLNRIKDYKKTSIFKSIVVFENFVRELEDSLKPKTFEQKMEF